MFIFKLFLFFNLIVIYCAHADSTGPSFVMPTPFEIEKSIQKAGLVGAENSIAVALVDLETHQVKSEYATTSSMPWASVSKMFSLFYAISILGPDDTFKTELKFIGNIADGELKGHLILEGGGDPSLNTDGLLNLALALKSRGVKKISGKFFYDERNFFNKQEISHFGLGDEPYNQSIGALNLYFNRLQIVRSKEKGFRSIPELPNFKIKEESSDHFSSGQRFKYVDNSNSLEEWIYNPRARFDLIEELPIKNPSKFTAFIFADLLKSMGIQVSAPEILDDSKADSAKTLAIVNSIKIFELARLAMEYSNNLYTEAILIKAARQDSKKALTLRESAERMMAWFKLNYPKIDWSSFSMINASGLTAENRFAAKMLATWLSQAYLTQFNSSDSHPYFYWALLPMAGQNSWLKERWNHPNFAHRLWAKTGTLDFVHSMAGVMVAKSGKMYAFSLSSSNLDSRNKLDKGEHFSQGAIGNFRDKSKKFFMELAQEWYERY